jgi:hypothetical protein
VQGDLHEEFDYQVQRVGLRKARRRYWRDVLGFARPFAIRRKQTPYPQPFFYHFPMLKSYLTIALRTLWRSKGTPPSTQWASQWPSASACTCS